MSSEGFGSLTARPTRHVRNSLPCRPVVPIPDGCRTQVQSRSARVSALPRPAANVLRSEKPAPALADAPISPAALARSSAKQAAARYSQRSVSLRPASVSSPAPLPPSWLWRRHTQVLESSRIAMAQRSVVLMCCRWPWPKVNAFIYFRLIVDLHSPHSTASGCSPV